MAREKKGEMRKCQVCGKEKYFTLGYLKKGYGNYCSNVCFGETLKTGEVKKCKICGTEKYFRGADLIRGRRGKYCSTTCRHEGLKRTKTAICSHCGKKIVRRSSHILRSKDCYCSPQCHNKFFANHPPKPHRRRQLPQPPLLLFCDFCGKDFKKNVSKMSKQSFCSSKCYRQFLSEKLFATRCGNCGKNIRVSNERMRKHNVHFCDLECRINYQKNHSSLVYPPELLRSLLEHDEATCGFPGCDNQRSPRSRWHVCAVHHQRIITTLHYRRIQRRETLKKEAPQLLRDDERR